MQTVEMSSWLPAPADAVFAYCASLAGFKDQFPFRLQWLAGPEQWSGGDVLDFRYRTGGVWLRHRAAIVQYEPGRSFTDVMERGFFRAFRHRHRFEPDGDGTRATDTVEFSLGLGDWIDRTAGRALVERSFQKRHASLKRHFSCGVHHANAAIP